LIKAANSMHMKSVCSLLDFAAKPQVGNVKQLRVQNSNAPPFHSANHVKQIDYYCEVIRKVWKHVRGYCSGGSACCRSGCWAIDPGQSGLAKLRG
jgi:hypothetical protein